MQEMTIVKWTSTSNDSPHSEKSKAGVLIRVGREVHVFACGQNTLLLSHSVPSMDVAL